MNVVIAHGWGNFSLAVASLAASLRDHTEVDVWVRSYRLQDADAAFLRDLTLLRPRVLALSCHFWSVGDARLLARAARALLPEVLVVAGGPEVGSDAAAVALLAQEEAVDLAVLGEGEETFRAIVEACAAGGDPRVPGTVSRRGGAVVIEPPRPLPALETLPDVFVEGDPTVERMLDRGGMVAVETLRGCRRQCSYCLYPTGRVRLFPLDRVLRELTFLCRRRVPAVRFTDSHFGGSRERALAILGHLAHENVETRFSLYPDPRHLDAEYVAALRAAGAEVISLGLQSATAEVLDRAGRQADRDAFGRGLSVLRAAGVEPQIDVILGLPGETVASFADTLGVLAGLGARHVLFSHLMCFAGTRLADEASAQGVELLDVPAHHVARTATLDAAGFARCYALAAWYKVIMGLTCTGPWLVEDLGLADICARLEAAGGSPSLAAELLDLLSEAPPATRRRKLVGRLGQLQALLNGVLGEGDAADRRPVLDELLRLDELLLALRKRTPIALGAAALRGPAAPPRLPPDLVLRRSPRVRLQRFAIDAKAVLAGDRASCRAPLGPPAPFLAVPTVRGPELLALDPLDAALLERLEDGARLGDAVADAAVRRAGGDSAAAVLLRVDHWMRNGALDGDPPRT